MSAYKKQYQLIAGGLLLGKLASVAFRQYKRGQSVLKLKGQVVAITGASSGIGKALAYELADAGCNLVLAARREHLIEEIAADLRAKFQIEVLPIPCDVARREEAEAMIEMALDTFGQIDILINNAGVSDYVYFAQDDPDAMRRVMDINYWGALYCMHKALPAMTARQQGLIVNVSSVAGKLAQPGIANYSATKHALNGLSQALRIELAPQGIRVLVICPTSTKTDIVATSNNNSGVKFNPDNFFGMSAEQVARETLAAILDHKREHILGLAERVGLGIYSWVPGLGDRLIGWGAKRLFRHEG